MATRNAIGSTTYVAFAVPATNNKAGFEALTYLELEHTQSLPQFGVSHNNIDVPDLKTGFTSGVKGSGTGMDSQGSCRIEGGALATVQAQLQTAAEGADGTITFKIVKGSGANNAVVAGDQVEYAQGYVHSYQENQRTDSSFEGFTYSFKQNNYTVKDVQPI